MSIDTRAGRSYGIRSLPLYFFTLTLSALISTPTLAELPPLTLNDASRRVLQNNPSLDVFDWRLKANEGSHFNANLLPAYEIGLEVENVGGTGGFSGADKAEFTLSLSSMIELGDKRQSRVAVVTSRQALTVIEREAAALDLLGLVTQRFIAILALQEKLAVAQDATALAESTYALVRTRVERGAAPEAERLRAQSATIQTHLKQKALAAELNAQKLSLAILWGSETVEFGQLQGNLYHFQKATDFFALYERASTGPSITVFANKARVRDAELALAKSQSSGNLRWSIGVRQFEETGDTGFVAGVSMPLFSERRNSGDMQTALAQRNIVNFQKKSSLLNLRARLFEAWSTHTQSASAAQEIRREVIPALESALIKTREAYERGRYSYIDWVAAQRELLDARVMVIDAASTALLNQALIEQLTAEPLSEMTESSLSATSNFN